MKRTLYLDTMLWNKLFEESVDPACLMERLRRSGWSIVFSPHLRYELSKTFRSLRPGREEKGRLLFSYVERYIELGIPCVKQVTDLLREEVKCANAQLPQVDWFYRDEEYEREAKEIRKLARGEVDAGIERVLDFRSGQVQKFREESPERSAKWAKHLGENGTASFAMFLDARMREVGEQCLRKHITDLFGELKRRDVKRIARRLLSAGRYRLSHALVRADVYLDWRCYCGRPVSKDTADDCYHIENAAYCDLYVTEEGAQTEYADELLSTTRVRTYDRGAPLAEWLVSKIRPESNPG